MANTDSFRQYALTGARLRLEDIREELQAIEQEFPELRQKRRGRPPRTQAASATGDATPGHRSSGEAEPAKPHRRRRRLSAAARKAISEAQKRRWAKQKRAGNQVQK
jgi:hypothetical protein